MGVSGRRLTVERCLEIGNVCDGVSMRPTTFTGRRRLPSGSRVCNVPVLILVAEQDVRAREKAAGRHLCGGVAEVNNRLTNTFPVGQLRFIHSHYGPASLHA